MNTPGMSLQKQAAVAPFAICHPLSLVLLNPLIGKRNLQMKLKQREYSTISPQALFYQAKILIVSKFGRKQEKIRLNILK